MNHADYLEYRPHPELSDQVCGYSIIRRNSATKGSIQHVLPDGCVEINFNLGAPVQRWNDDGKNQWYEKAYAVSRFSKPYHLQRTGSAYVVGIRFRTWGLQAFTDIPVAEFKDQTISLQNIFGDAPLILHENLMNSPADCETIELLDQFLLDRLRRSERESVFSAVARQIFMSKGAAPLETTLTSFGFTQRRIEQLFKHQIGISPKFYLRLIRFQHAVKLLSANSHNNVCQTAADCGYFDQPHFIHDFRRFSGTTPGQFLRESHPLSDAMARSFLPH